MRFLVCIATLSCCLSGLHALSETLAYSGSAQKHLLTEHHEGPALDMFITDFRQKVAPDGTLLVPVAAATTHSSCLL